MAQSTTDGANTLYLHFNQQVLDTQKSSFCCSDTDSRKLIRWVGCQPGVYQSAQALFTSKDLAFCNWFQSVDDYNYTTVKLSPNETYELDLQCSFILVKASFPSSALESEKLIELGIGEQGGYIGMTIPFMIGTPTTSNYKYMVMKELFMLNTNSLLTTPLWLNNISPYDVSISILHAN